MVFFAVELCEFLKKIFFWLLIPYQRCGSQMFFAHSVGCLFILWMVSLAVKKLPVSFRCHGTLLQSHISVAQVTFLVREYNGWEFIPVEPTAAILVAVRLLYYYGPTREGSTGVVGTQFT